MKITTQQEWVDYLAYRKEKLSRLFDIPNSKLEELILDNDYRQGIFCSARRVGKTYKILCRMLFDLVHLEWYNGACIRKYQQQVESKLLLPMINIIQDFLKHKIIKVDEAYQIKKSRNAIYFNNRVIHFMSIENPNNALGVQPQNNSRSKCQPLIQFVFIDEIVQALDNYKLSIEKMLENLKVIKTSLNRGIQAPFGRSYQEYWALNPWDYSNDIYLENVEAKIPVGTHYISDKMQKVVTRNHNELLKGKGELVWTDSKLAKFAYRASDIIIPKQRFNEEMILEETEMKTNDYGSWLCYFKGIHAPMANSMNTYLPNMPKKPIFYNEKKHGELYHITIGLDRGLRDDTAFSLVAIAKDKEGFYTLVILDTKVFYAKKRETKLTYVINNLQFLNEWTKNFPTRGKIDIITDYASKEFNNYFADIINENEKFRIKFNVIKARKDKKYEWDIPNRQDFFNKLFAQRKLVFHNKMTNEKIEELWMHYHNCLNNEKGEREEKPGVNKLDIINSIEYAISYTNRYLFNI